jgi:pimeloyl-ACP methyl ester carboxylesterase
MAGILLINGALHGPWCWDDFARRLAAQGHDARTMYLRPEGGLWNRVRAYVEEARQAATAFPVPPILVGHSLGGLVVQKYLERYTALGGILLATPLPGGALRSVSGRWLDHPWPMLKSTLTMRFRPLVATPALVRALLFTPDTPPEIVDRCFARLEDDSSLALLAALADLPRPQRVTAPMLFLGAERDAMVSPAAVRQTARAYRAEAEIFPGMGHDMMLDRGWEAVADRIAAWAGEVAARPRGGRP